MARIGLVIRRSGVLVRAILVWLVVVVWTRSHVVDLYWASRNDRDLNRSGRNVMHLNGGSRNTVHLNRRSRNMMHLDWRRSRVVHRCRRVVWRRVVVGPNGSRTRAVNWTRTRTRRLAGSDAHLLAALACTSNVSSVPSVAAVSSVTAIPSVAAVAAVASVTADRLADFFVATASIRVGVMRIMTERCWVMGSQRSRHGRNRGSNRPGRPTEDPQEVVVRRNEGSNGDASQNTSCHGNHHAQISLQNFMTRSVGTPRARCESLIPGRNLQKL